jgi:hypothetical protein
MYMHIYISTHMDAQWQGKGWVQLVTLSLGDYQHDWEDTSNSCDSF